MKKIFVAGAGTMGLDIAHVFARSGFKVVLRDISDEILQRADAKLQKTLDKLIAKGKIDEAAKAGIIGNITFTTVLSDAADCDLVVEAILENLELKKPMFQELDRICKAETIFASNTSAISITELASATNRSEQFVGMHFFNPATVMKLVEVIRGENTSDATFESVYRLSQDVGKEPVEIAESPGFVVNRLLVPMINDAIFVYAEGVASVGDIDRAMQLGANHPMGPLALGDFIGLDVCLAIMKTLHAETGDPKYRPAPLLRKMVRAKKLGKKTGEGFYQY